MLRAQTTTLPPFDEYTQQQPGLFQRNLGSSYRICTPADYADPTSECISQYGQGASNYYGGYEEPGYGLRTRVPYAAHPPSMLQTRPTEGMPGSLPEEVQPPRRSFPKEPPTEFQRYVARFVGHKLPIFGESLFEGVPATFAPLNYAPPGPNYSIAPGDELQITAWGKLNFSRRVIVDRSGVVTFPDVGPVTVAGLTDAEATNLLKTALGRIYKNFDLSVTLGRLHSIQIFVLGEARRPGSYTVSSLSTLVNAIFASGGPSPHGSMRGIQLRRGNKVICELDLYDLLLYGDKSQDARLEPGDVIFIPEAGPHVAIAGSVRHPAIYELKPGATLRNLLHFAEGPSPLASTKQVHLQRIDDHSSLHVIHVSLNRKGLDTQLQSGDIIQLTPLVPHFDNAITLKGNVADAGRYPWKPGMRLSDLIPNKEALLTREYWDARNAEVQTADAGRDDEEKAPKDSKAKDVAISYRSQDRNARGDSSLAAATELDNVPPLRTFNPSNSVEPLAPEIDWQYALVERTDRRTLETRRVPFNLGKLVLDHDETQNLLLRPGDVVTIFSKADFSVPRSQQSKQVRIEGEVAMAGVYSVSPGETLRELVERAGGLTRDAYLYGAQFTRESTRREQQKRYEDFLNHYELEADQAAANLSSRVTSPQQAATAQASLTGQRDLIEKLRKVSMNGRIVLNIDPKAHGLNALPDLSLENGDRLYIPSRPSTVTVMGSVFEQTSFLYREDFRVGDYLNEAGGPTRNADRKHMFVIRADGSVISNSRTSPLFAKSFESRHLYPGDTIVVPAQLNRSTFLRSLTDWSQLFSNFALGAAAVNLLH